jgi:hypothetical protein
MYASKPYRDCVELQQVIMAYCRLPTEKPVTLAALARSYCELEECKRKLKMRPLPKPIDVTPKLRQLNASPQQFIEAATDEANPKGISSTGEG